MKDAITLAREAGMDEVDAEFVGHAAIDRLVTLTREDMLADLVKGAEPVAYIVHRRVDVGVGMDTDAELSWEQGAEDEESEQLYDHEAVAAAVAQAKQQARDEYRAELLAGAGEPVGTLNIRKFRGHLENRELDYWGSLPDGTYQLYTPEAVAAAVAQSAVQVRKDSDAQIMFERGVYEKRIADLEAQLAAARADALEEAAKICDAVAGRCLHPDEIAVSIRAAIKESTL